MVTIQPTYSVSVICEMVENSVDGFTYLKSFLNLSCLFFAFSESRTVSIYKWNKRQRMMFWEVLICFVMWSEMASQYLSQDLEGTYLLELTWVKFWVMFQSACSIRFFSFGFCLWSLPVPWTWMCFLLTTPYPTHPPTPHLPAPTAQAKRSKNT